MDEVLRCLVLFQVGFGVRKYHFLVTQPRAWLEERGKVEQTELRQWDVPSLLYWRETAGLNVAQHEKQQLKS